MIFGKYYSTDILEDFWPYAFGLTENGIMLLRSVCWMIIWNLPMNWLYMIR